MKIGLPCWIATTRRAVKDCAVAAAVDFVDDGHPGIAGAQEIGVQRMADAILDGAVGRDQRLTQDLPAEDALPAVLGRHAAEDVVLDPLKVEQGQELGQRAPSRRRPGLRRRAFPSKSCS